MIGKICGLIIVISFIFGVVSGNTAQMGSAAMEGASNAVTLTVSLVGMMCLWTGIMNVADASGVTKLMAKIMSPVLRLLFPDAYKKQNGTGE